MSYTVRPAESKDASAIAALLCEIHTQHKNGRPDLFGGGEPKFDESAVLSLLSSDNTVVFSAIDETDILCGYAIALLKETAAGVQRAYTSFYIDDINVAAAHRRQGVGKLLLDACKKEATARQCYNITLNVWSFNDNAIRFYEKNGFSCQRMIMEEILKPIAEIS